MYEAKNTPEFCYECGQERPDLLPRYGAVTAKQAAKPGCNVKAGDHCQTCLALRAENLPQSDAKAD